MPSPPTNSYQVINLFDWTGGIRDNRRNPLLYPENSLVSGENVDLVTAGLKTRAGCSVAGTLPIPDGGSQDPATTREIRMLTQIRFPAREKNYLIAQAQDAAGNNRVYACGAETPGPWTSDSWTEIADLTNGAGVVSIAVLGDRAVITEGLKKPPLIFAGCLDDLGSDWARPRAVLVTRNNGVDWSDLTAQVCNGDTDTGANIGNLDPVTGWLAVCLDMAVVAGFHFDMLSGNTRSGSLVVEGYASEWSSGSGWVDDTAALNRSGTVTHSGGPFSAGYHVENNVPGYWYRFRWSSGTSENTLVQRIVFKAPCQTLQVIGEPHPDTVLGFLYWDESDKSAKDFTGEVSDSSCATYARLNDGLSDNPTGMSGADAIYIGYSTTFDAVELTPHNDYNNKTASVFSGSYWNGATWTGLTGFSDSTQEPSGKSLGKKGKLSWKMPADWSQNHPIGAQFPNGYWIRLKVSSNLTPKTYISDARIWPTPIPLKRHKLALALGDRMILCRSSEAPNRVLMSRPGEPHGFTGALSAAVDLGGKGEIVAAVEAFNQGFLAKTDDWYLLGASSAGLCSVERIEAAGQAPINNLVITRATHREPDGKNLMGLYYINQAGAWYFSGTKLYHVSQDVSWWDPASNLPKLDLENLYKACAVYWPEKNRLIWSVPMIVEGTSQPTNNRLIVYDLTLQTWLPPLTVSVGALTSAYGHNPTAPGKLGHVAVYGGDYHGRILRLFGPNQEDDVGSEINACAETGWLHLGSPQYTKIIRSLSLYGRNSGDRVSLLVFTDGEMGESTHVGCSGLSGWETKAFSSAHIPMNIAGRFFKFRITFTGPAEIYGLQIGAAIIREWGSR